MQNSIVQLSLFNPKINGKMSSAVLSTPYSDELTHK